ncbi:MAG TPA: amidohydrolase family protein [Thermoanaerobaculia bacterium]|nr:amidohydrolase family protein [Thermoanaerobaculia bacterium]
MNVAIALLCAIVIENVTVIDGTNRPPSPGMTVIVRGDRIERIGRTGRVRVPRGAEVVSGDGKFLIPGLWDMHVHVGDGDFDRTSLQLFVANGVTGIRVMDGAPQHHEWERARVAGTLVAPRMMIGSEIIGFSPTDEAEALKAARLAKEQGAEFLKVHDQLSRAGYFALVRESKLPIEGHVPASITAEEAARAGQKSIEHLTRVTAADIPTFVRYGTWHCPTLMMRRNYALLTDQKLKDDPRLAYMKPSWRTRWARMSEDALQWPTGEAESRTATIRNDFALVAKMQQAGVHLLAGTDDGNPYSYLGFGVHDELIALVDAGLTPLQALQTATRNPAQFRGKLATLGTIERGKIADLVLLNANPFDNIRNTSKIEAVVMGGKLYRRAALDAMLENVRAAAAAEQH